MKSVSPHGLSILLAGALSASAMSVSVAETACPSVALPDFNRLLLAPPCDECAITKAELQELQALQERRTKESADYASADYNRTPERFLIGIGVKVDASALSRSEDVLKCAAEAVKNAVGEAKTKFNRTRPYKLPNNQLSPLKDVKEGDDASYPSGHAAYGAVTGAIMMAMDPAMKDKIAWRIEDFGFSRLVSGVHYRSDVYAGEVVGGLVAAQLLSDPGFRKAVDEAAPDFKRAIEPAK